jgi:hypothetical protein
MQSSLGILPLDDTITRSNRGGIRTRILRQQAPHRVPPVRVEVMAQFKTSCAVESHGRGTSGIGLFAVLYH